MTTQVTDNPDRSQFEITDDGELTGFAQYFRHENEIAFIHTEIDPAFAGRGLAGTLARAALDAAREQGADVLPYCPFIQGWLTKHPDYVDLAPQAQRTRFDL